MKATTFNNAIVTTISAYAEVLQELVKENNLLKDQVRALHMVNAGSDEQIIVPRKQYMRLKAELTSYDPKCEFLATAARDLVSSVEGEGWDEVAR